MKEQSVPQISEFNLGIQPRKPM